MKFHPQGDFNPEQWAWPHGDWHRGGQPYQKPLRQWRYDTAIDPSIPATITPDIHPRSPGHGSTMSLCWRKRRHPPSEKGRHPRSFPQGCRRHAFHNLPGLGVPKSWYPPGWRNLQGWKWQAKWKKSLFPHQMLWCTLWTGRDFFVLTLTLELNSMKGRKWNAYNMIVFQTVII